MSAKDELSALNLEDDFKEVLSTSDAKRWNLKKSGPLEVFATMAPIRAPHELFQARLLWHSYPDELPSLKFRDPENGRLDKPSAWPKVRGFRPTSLDACVNYCVEGFIIHPEWKNDPAYRLEPVGNLLLTELRILQDELDNHFEGRHP